MIVIPNRRSLDDLIQVNLKRAISSIPVNNPSVSSVSTDKEYIKELNEALEFSANRYAGAANNRFAALELTQDNALASAMKALTDFVKKGQSIYDIEVERIEKEFGLKDILRNDVNALFHSKEVKKAIESLRKATIPIVKRLDEIQNCRIDDMIDDDSVSFFVLAALKKLHKEE